MDNRLRTLLLLGAVTLGASGCAMRPTEPRNLDLAKADVAAYVDDGRYLREVSAVAEEARGFVEKRAARRKEGERLAVVFDVDETALSNLPQIRAMGWGYSPTGWVEWVARGEAPALEPVLLLFRAVQHAGIETIFITGRLERRDGPGTIRNLRDAGYTGYSWLILKPDDSALPTGVFKTETRQKLEKEGFTIIANVGDQESDFENGSSGKTFKLPTPFYLVK